ncbi:MAG TPA: hypothetical protein VG247_21650 [Pseudonocardiaceae bacterium]|jgi:hypothetical protein|nr:hypothetical protein [Pseudonocardiaceae bacterium]
MLLLGATVAAIAAVPAGAATPHPASWQENLSQAHNDDVNTAWTGHALGLRDVHTRGSAMDIFPAHPLAAATNELTVTAGLSRPAGTSVEIDVRGQTAHGAWTEWTTATPGRATRLSAPAKLVQTRVTLSASAQGATPDVTSLEVTADPSTPSPAATATALSYRVFATDEGLVGGKTANGHIIVANDHFVALPSPKALSPLNSNEYSVQVCAVHCVTAPVWDVGPWNLNDNYWDSPRAEFTDLPQGEPEAQAANLNGYNGGLDDEGGSPSNPAGIDLADGTFADVGLTDNGYVTVTYLWTGSTPPPPPPTPGTNASSSSTVVLNNGTISHFTRDVNGHVWDSSITAAGVIQPAYDLTGNAPHTPATKGTPTAAVAPNGTVDVITTDANGHVINTPINTNGTLGPVYDLTANAGKAGGIPAASGNTSIVVKSDGTAVVVDRASTGNVWTIAWGSTTIGPAYDWTANSPHTPSTNGTPTAAVTPSGAIDIISTDTTGHVINSPWNANGTLGPVYDLTANAGKSGGIPAASGNTSIVVKSDGTAVVVDRASTGNVWTIAWGSTTIGPAYDWTANSPHTPATNGTPTAAIAPNGTIDIISTDTNGHVINSPWNANGTLGPVYDLTANAGKSGGIAAASGNASIVVQSNGNATVFDAATTHQVWSIAWGPTFIGPAYDWTANNPHTPLAY